MKTLITDETQDINCGSLNVVLHIRKTAVKYENL